MEVAAYITAIATVVLAGLTWQNVRAATRLIEAQLDPRIVIAFQQIQSQDNFFGIVMKNMGASPAYRVKTSIRTENRPLDLVGFLPDVREFFTNEWPVLNAGEVITRHIDMDAASEERRSGSQIYVCVQYADAPHRPRKHCNEFLITPYWKEGTLLGPPGVWREVDSRVNKLTSSIDSSAKNLERVINQIGKN